MRPAVVFIGRTTLDPADPALAAKLAVLSRHLRPVVIGLGSEPFAVGDASVVPAAAPRPPGVSTILFYVRGPVLALRAAEAAGADVIVCQSPYEAATLRAVRSIRFRGRSCRLLVEIHGDWRTASRMYGSPIRRLISPLADRVARWGVLGSDRVRAVGSFTAQLARDVGYEGPIDVYPAYSDVQRFLDREPVDPPWEPRVLYVGALEATKGIDTLLDAWPEVAARVPDANLTLIGRGRYEPRARAAAAGEGHRIEYRGAVAPADVLAAMDASQVVVIPSRSEGLGRVILEAMARGRPVVGSAVGGIVELVEHGTTGILVPPDDPQALAGALCRTLQDRAEAQGWGAAGRETAERLSPARRFEEGMASLAAWASGSSAADGRR